MLSYYLCQPIVKIADALQARCKQLIRYTNHSTASFADEVLAILEQQVSVLDKRITCLQQLINGKNRQLSDWINDVVVTLIVTFPQSGSTVKVF